MRYRLIHLICSFFHWSVYPRQTATGMGDSIKREKGPFDMCFEVWVKENCDYRVENDIFHCSSVINFVLIGGRST